MDFHWDDVEGLLVFALFRFVDDPSLWSSVARTTAAFLRDFVEPRFLGWTVHASWPFGWVTCCRHFVIAHLMAHWLCYTCGRLWLSVSKDRLLILDGDDARTPWGSAPLTCKLVQLCIGITLTTLWSLHPDASRVDGSNRVFAFLFEAGLSTSASRLRTTTRRWKGQTTLRSASPRTSKSWSASSSLVPILLSRLLGPTTPTRQPRPRRGHQTLGFLELATQASISSRLSNPPTAL